MLYDEKKEKDAEISKCEGGSIMKRHVRTVGGCLSVALTVPVLLSGCGTQDTVNGKTKVEIVQYKPEAVKAFEALEAKFNETLHLHNGEEVRYVEYAPGKYWETTEKEYKIFLNKVATEFEHNVESNLRSMANAEQLRYLLSLQEWAQDMFDEPFSLRR